MEYEISNLKSEAIDKCFNSQSSELMNIMREMIEKAYHAGRKQGQKEMSREAKTRLMGLIPDDLYTY